MNPKEILTASYLDILFEGKNKKYGGYELRKKYPRRAAIAGLLAVLVVGGVFAAMMIKPKAKVEEAPEEIFIETVMENLEQPPPVDESAPPPPPPPPVQQPVRTTVQFTVPDVKKDNEVVQEAKLSTPPPENVDVGKSNEEGSDDPNAIPADIAGLSGVRGGTGVGPVGEPGGTGSGEEEILSVVQEPADFPGWQKYLDNNLRYPQEARDAGVEGVVQVSFVVEKDGSITRVKVVRGANLGFGLAEEAVRVVQASPKWKPGKQSGRPVRSTKIVRVIFSLQ